MNTSFCEEELKFIRNNIKINNRIDFRKITEERETNYKIDILISTDKSIEMVLGKTKILVTVNFKSTIDTVKELLSENNLQIDEICQKYEKNDINNEILELEFIKDLQNDENYELFLKNMILMNKEIIFKELIEILKNNKIGVMIETRIIENDGNIFDAFFKSLNIIFMNIEIPSINELNGNVIQKIEIPQSQTYAIFENNKLIKDPTLLEEKSSEGLIHFMENKQIFFKGHFKYENIDNILTYSPF